MADPSPTELVPLDPKRGLWESFFMVAPLVVVGTREPDGGYDLAPKHMVAPLSWEDHFGFVCTPAHATYRNVVREKQFTVSFPRPDQVVLTSLAAAPRSGDNSKPALQALPTNPAERVEGVLLQKAYLHFECELDRIVDGFAKNSLIVGRIVAARVASDAIRGGDTDDQDLLAEAPLLAYLHPGRYACIERSFSFPFHKGFSR